MTGIGRSTFTQLESSRLVLRRFRDSDLPTFLVYVNDPEVARYQSWEPYDERRARAFIRDMQQAESGRAGHWFQFAIGLQGTGAHIGDCALGIGVKHLDARQAEIGYSLARPHWGNGYATEAIGRLLHYAFGELKVHRIVAVVDCRNPRSCAVVERLGFRREGHFLQNFWSRGMLTL